MEIMLNLTSRCNLQCKNCALEHMTKEDKKNLPKDMSFDTFVVIVDKLIEYGYDEFQLTPTVGEPFLNKDFLKMIGYLEKNDAVKRITFFTNLCCRDLEEELKWLFDETTKTVMFISFYGTNRKDFNSFTNSNTYFDIFHRNIKWVRFFYKSTFRSMNFFLRNPEIENAIKSDMYSFINVYSKLKESKEFFDKNNIQKHYWNGNWCNFRNNVDNLRWDTRRSICWFTIIDNIVDSDGSIFLCGACDVMRETKLGNLFEQSLEEIYSKENSVISNVIEHQSESFYNECCDKCSEFHECPSESWEGFKKLHKW